MSAANTKLKHDAGGKARPAAARLRKLRAHARARLEDYLRQAGFGDPAELRVGRSYRLEANEVSGFAEVKRVDDDVYYRVALQVMPLPSDAELIVPLQRELLEVNGQILGPARLSIQGDAVWAGVQDVVALMPDGDFGRYIDATLGVARGAMAHFERKYTKTTKRRKGRAPRGRRAQGAARAMLF